MRAVHWLAAGAVAAMAAAGPARFAASDAVVRLPARAPAGNIRAARVWAKLRTVRLTVDFDEMGVRDCLAFLKQTAGVNLVLSPQAREDFYLADRRVTLQVTDLPLGAVLRLVLDQAALVARWKHGLLYVGREEENVTPPVLRLYDVRDLTRELQDFPGPSLQLQDGSARTTAWMG